MAKAELQTVAGGNESSIPCMRETEERESSSLSVACIAALPLFVFHTAVFAPMILVMRE